MGMGIGYGFSNVFVILLINKHQPTNTKTNVQCWWYFQLKTYVSKCDKLNLILHQKAQRLSHIYNGSPYIQHVNQEYLVKAVGTFKRMSHFTLAEGFLKSQSWWLKAICCYYCIKIIKISSVSFFPWSFIILEFYKIFPVTSWGILALVTGSANGGVSLLSHPWVQNDLTKATTLREFHTRGADLSLKEFKKTGDQVESVPLRCFQSVKTEYGL